MGAKPVVRSDESSALTLAARNTVVANSMELFVSEASESIK